MTPGRATNRSWKQFPMHFYCTASASRSARSSKTGACVFTRGSCLQGKLWGRPVTATNAVQLRAGYLAWRPKGQRAPSGAERARRAPMCAYPLPSKWAWWQPCIWTTSASTVGAWLSGERSQTWRVFRRFVQRAGSSHPHLGRRSLWPAQAPTLLPSRQPYKRGCQLSVPPGELSNGQFAAPCMWPARVPARRICQPFPARLCPRCRMCKWHSVWKRAVTRGRWKSSRQSSHKPTPIDRPSSSWQELFPARRTTTMTSRRCYRCTCHR